MREGKQLSRFLVVMFFSVAMGFLEAVVVVYLRELYYPEGFRFPLVVLPSTTVGIEYLRELATLVMLAAVGYLAGRNFTGRFGWFLFSFGIWDLFYYVSLKLMLGWPLSWFTWDILFLIPVVWAAPVLAPVISAVTMVVYGIILEVTGKGNPPPLARREWAFLLGGALIVFLTFIRDYGGLLWHYLLHGKGHGMNGEDLLTAVTTYVPQQFAWIPFLAGEVLIVVSLLLWVRRTRSVS